MPDIIDYLPENMRGYKEFKSIMQTEKIELNELKRKMEAVISNAFIADCDLDGIGRYEGMLQIVPNSYDTLESRQLRVLTRCHDRIPYTYHELLKRLDMLCGIGNYEIFPDFKNYQIDIMVDLPLSSQIEELDRMFDEVIPCNLLVNCKNELNILSKGFVYIAPALSNYCSIEIITDMEGAW